MLIKIFKNIHNKYLTFFKFVLFLRYLVAIFVIASMSFILIPKLFNYEKKFDSIQNYLINNYNFLIQEHTNIEYNVFPLPNLSIKDVKIKIKGKPLSVSSKNLTIFLKLQNIYDFKDYSARKILLKESKIVIDINDTKYFKNFFEKINNKIDIEELNLYFENKSNPIFKITNINFSNYGYKKYKINGKIFDKAFKASFKDDKKIFSIKIIKSGINADLVFNEYDKEVSGFSKINVLKNFIYLNFFIDENSINLTKSRFKNKDLFAKFDSLIKFNPFFEINTNLSINEFNKDISDFTILKKIFKNPEIIKKLNSKNKVYYQKKKFSKSLINTFSSEINLFYGRLYSLDKISFEGGNIVCKNESNLVEQYPRIYFDCMFYIENKKNFLKNFSINKKENNNQVHIKVLGSLNILNKKINFEKILIDKEKKIRDEELEYFKEAFEVYIFNENFLNIFKEKKIKNFLQEII